MVIDKRLKAGQIRMSFIATFTAGTILILYSLTDTSLIGDYTLFAGALFMMVYLLIHLRQFYYFYYKETNKKVIIRFYYTHIFMQNYKSIEIDKRFIINYLIKTNMFGLQKYLIIEVKTPKGQGKYPPISISILNKNDIKALRLSLNNIIKSNNQQ